jgi:hypothetical protein
MHPGRGEKARVGINRDATVGEVEKWWRGRWSVPDQWSLTEDLNERTQVSAPAPKSRHQGFACRGEDWNMWAVEVHAVLWQVLCFENTADGRTSKRAEAAPVLAEQPYARQSIQATAG